MKMNSMDNAAVQTTPRTSTVLVFLMAFAIMMSWLCVYALTNALIAADILPAWPADADPRPRWMLNAFAGFFGAAAIIGLLFRWISHRQLRRIDAIAEAEG